MIGNWVLAGAKAQFPMQVVSIFQDEVYLDFEGNEGDCFEYGEKDMLPIPLTEELLVKNGFTEGVSSNPTYYTDKENNIFISLMNNTSVSIRITSEIGARVSTYRKTRYLHELQNLLTMAGIKMEFRI